MVVAEGAGDENGMALSNKAAKKAEAKAKEVEKARKAAKQEAAAAGRGLRQGQLRPHIHNGAVR